MKQEMGLMQIMTMSLQTDNHASTSSLDRPDGLPGTQPSLFR